MNREVHAPFCERPGVKLPRPTHPWTKTNMTPLRGWAPRGKCGYLAERVQDAETKRAGLLMADGCERLARYMASLEAAAARRSTSAFSPSLANWPLSEVLGRWPSQDNGHHAGAARLITTRFGTPGYGERDHAFQLIWEISFYFDAIKRAELPLWSNKHCQWPCQVRISCVAVSTDRLRGLFGRGRFWRFCKIPRRTFLLANLNLYRLRTEQIIDLFNPLVERPFGIFGHQKNAG